MCYAASYQIVTTEVMHAEPRHVLLCDCVARLPPAPKRRMQAGRGLSLLLYPTNLRGVPLNQRVQESGCRVTAAGLRSCIRWHPSNCRTGGSAYESRLTMSWMVLVGLSPQVALLDSLSSRAGGARRSSATPASAPHAPSCEARSR